MRDLELSAGAPVASTSTTPSKTKQTSESNVQLGDENKKRDDLDCAWATEHLEGRVQVTNRGRDGILVAMERLQLVDGYSSRLGALPRSAEILSDLERADLERVVHDEKVPSGVNRNWSPHNNKTRYWLESLSHIVRHAHPFGRLSGVGLAC